MAASTAVRGRNLRGPERVAALLLAMGKPVAERLLPHFEAAELKRISRSAAGLGPVPSDQMEALIEDFAGQFSVGLNLLGSAREIENLMSGVIPPEQIAEFMSDAPAKADHSSEETVWERVGALPDEVVAGYLQQEHPQAVALVLSKLDPGAAAKALGHMPKELRSATMRRILATQPPPEPALRLLSTVLDEDLLESAAKDNPAEKHGRLARIINKMNRDDAESTLQALAATEPDAAEALKAMLFSFEDFPKLSPSARAALVEKAPTDQLVVALKGAEEALTEAVLSSMTSRTRRVVESELKTGGTKPREVQEARRAIADIALAMAGSGEIRLDGNEDEEAA